MTTRRNWSRKLRWTGGAVAVGLIVVAAIVWTISHRSEIALRLQQQAGIGLGLREEHHIPEGYVGWVTVTYDVPDAPELPLRDGVLVFNYEGTGSLRTSSPMNEGFRMQDFLSSEAGRPVRLLVAGRGEELLLRDPTADERRIWHVYTGRVVTYGDETAATQRSGFFVGTRRQYEAMPDPAPLLPEVGARPEPDWRPGG